MAWPMNYAPYAPPQHDQGPYGGGAYVQHVYRPLGWKTTVSIVGVAATVVLSFLQTGASLANPDLLKHPEENLGPILALGLLGLVTSVVAIGTYVFFLLWMHQAAKNVRAFGQVGLEYTPGWCVGWWFIPVASLWKPFTAMREIWKASDPDTVGPGAASHWMAAPVPATMGVWWGIYILNGFVGAGIALSSLDLSGAAKGVTVGPATFISHALLGIAGALLIMIMRQLAARQETAWQRLSNADRMPVATAATAPNPYTPNPYT